MSVAVRGVWRKIVLAGSLAGGLLFAATGAQAQVSAGCAAIQAQGTVNASAVIGGTVSFGPFGPFDEGIHEQPADGDTIRVAIGGRDIDVTVTFQGASNDVQTLQAAGQRFATLVIGGPTFPEDQNVTINVRTDRIGAGAQARVTLSCQGTPNPGQDPVGGGAGGGAGNADAAETAAAAETTVQSAENAVRLPTTAPALGSTFGVADKLVTPSPSFRDPERIRQAAENESAFREQFEQFHKAVRQSVLDRIQGDGELGFNKIIGQILGQFRPSFANVVLANFTNGQLTEIADLQRDDNGRVVRDDNGKPRFSDAVPRRKLTPEEARVARTALQAIQEFADTAFADRLRDTKLRGTREGAQFTRQQQRREALEQRGEGLVRRLTELGADTDTVRRFVSGNILFAQTVADNFNRQLRGLERAADALDDGNARTAVNAVLDVLSSSDGFDFNSDVKQQFGKFNAVDLPEDLANEETAARERAASSDDFDLHEGEAVLFTPHGRNGITFGLDSDSLGRLMAAASGAPDGASRSFLDRRFKLWMKGRIAALDGNRNGVDGTTGELLVGGVYRVAPKVELGALGGYFMSDLTADGTGTNSDTRSGKAGLYSNILFDNGMVLGISGTYERGNTDTERAGVRADFGYSAYDLSGSVSGAVRLGQWVLSPSGALTLGNRHTEGHTDSAGTFVAGRTETDLIGTGSLAVSRSFRVQQAWLRSVTPSAVVTGNYFLTSRDTVDFDHLDFNIGAGVALGIREKSTLSLNIAAGGFGQNTQSYSGQVRLTIPF